MLCNNGFTWSFLFFCFLTVITFWNISVVMSFTIPYQKNLFLICSVVELMHMWPDMCDIMLQMWHSPYWITKIMHRLNYMVLVYFTPNNFSLKEVKKVDSFKVLNFFKLKTAPHHKSTGQIKLVSHNWKHNINLSSINTCKYIHYVPYCQISSNDTTHSFQLWMAFCFSSKIRFIIFTDSCLWIYFVF